jgi:hypothetical protein
VDLAPPPGRLRWRLALSRDPLTGTDALATQPQPVARHWWFVEPPPEVAPEECAAAWWADFGAVIVDADHWATARPWAETMSRLLTIVRPHPESLANGYRVLADSPRHVGLDVVVRAPEPEARETFDRLAATVELGLARGVRYMGGMPAPDDVTGWTQLALRLVPRTPEGAFPG